MALRAALSYVIRYDPHVDPVGNRFISADSPDIHVILAAALIAMDTRSLTGHPRRNAGSLAENLADLVRGYLLFGFDIHRFRVP